MSTSAAESLNVSEAVELTQQSAAAVTFGKRRVIVYAMNYAPEIVGVGKYTGEIAEHLAEQGLDVTVVTTPPHYPSWEVQSGYRNWYSSSHENGLRVVRAPLILKARMRGIWRLLAPLSFAMTSAPLIFWQILSRRPDTVFCIEPTLFAAPVAQLAAKLIGAQTILHVQDLEVDAAFAVRHLKGGSWIKRLGYAFERVTLRGFDKVITISNRMADKLADKGVAGNRLSVIRNWVDLSHIYPIDEVSPYRTELGFDQDDFVVLYSGTIGAKQSLHVLLDAAERLQDESRIHTVIAGEGPLKAELQSRYGHLRNVRFLPFQSNARLNDFFNMPDLHVLPQEKAAADLGLPSKIGGMLASGRPILVTAEEGTELADFLAGSVLIVPPGDTEALAAAFVSLRGAAPGAFRTGSELAQSLSKSKALQAIAEACAR